MYATLLTFHILVGAAGLLLGPILMWADSHRPRSRDIGIVYLGAVAAVCLSATALVLWWRPELWWLIPLSVLTFALALLGRYSAGRAGVWTHAYVHGLGGSYIALVTATVVVSFAVDGPLYGGAQVVAWVGPSVIGVVLLEVWRRRSTRRMSR
ncbi:Uncharacterised protein [Nocardia otitidiscaviarum]|uniref:DUF2306 domain-containing protein n=1 Tax=Nocardia otitidiscaviarum TaxID=1823 RepID=A0A378YRS2_9NOCA|nr:hypothetical protein [Nocardia otitidiscaviarum]MBF6238975.1 hypothetical protein [Nocardia otitidiscaviarum]SUA79197.1 Uncharacterised protein [Nocardia otitidiscaviarum]